MFSIHQLSKSIDDLSRKCLDADAFEEWFVSESWGHYNVGGDSLSQAIGAVHHVLHSYESGEIEERQLAEELANALHPFVVANTTTVLKMGPSRCYWAWASSASMASVGAAHA